MGRHVNSRRAQPIDQTTWKVIESAPVRKISATGTGHVCCKLQYKLQCQECRAIAFKVVSGTWRDIHIVKCACKQIKNSKHKPCLKCDKPFKAESKYHRMCEWCRTKASGLGVYYANFVDNLVPA